MKSISDSDFSILAQKLPIVLQYAKESIPATDIKALNALRVLAVLQKKLIRTNPVKTKDHDKK